MGSGDMPTSYSHKFANTVLFLLHECAPHRPGITGLLKMLFFVDFWHYRMHLRTVTTSKYVALERGPVVDGYKQLFAAMVADGLLKKHEATVLGHAEKKVEYLPRQEPDESAFSSSELEVLKEVAARYGRTSGVDLSEKSHLEGPWVFAWDPASPGNEIPPALFRWVENLPDEDDLDEVKGALKRVDLKSELRRAR